MKIEYGEFNGAWWVFFDGLPLGSPTTKCAAANVADWLAKNWDLLEEEEIRRDPDEAPPDLNDEPSTSL